MRRYDIRTEREGNVAQGEFDQATIVEQYVPDHGHRRVLLFSPPVYDTRFPWSQWQQPLTLLQLGTLLKRNGCDVRLIDALHVKSGDPIRRQRVRIIDRGDVALNYWRFGTLKSYLIAQLRACAREKWFPDAVYIECGTTFWWEGAREVAELVRERFPKAMVILCGAYPQYASSHAAANVSADVVVAGAIAGLSGLPLDLSLYPSRPIFSHIIIGSSERSSDDILDEIADKASFTSGEGRVTRFAFADHDVAARFPALFRSVLEGVIERTLHVSFFALGTILPQTLSDDPPLAQLMKRAGYKQIVFADDRNDPINETARAHWVEVCRRAVEHCQRAGYRVRTDAVSAMLSVGRPGERLEDVSAHMTRLAHVAGSLIPVPYQPMPQECPDDLPLEMQNGKIFPFAERNGVTYREYQDVLGLAALFNSKYRSRTFDFAGDSLVSRLVQESLASGSWDPRSAPDGLHERPITVGWFNKEGKWVKS